MGPKYTTRPLTSIMSESNRLKQYCAHIEEAWRECV